MRQSSAGLNDHSSKGGILCLNSELWHACAGPLVSLPAIGTKVMYFPQGHIEQVAASINKDVDVQAPNYPSLPPQLICQLHNVTMHTDIETDEVYAQLTLQPLSPQEQKEVSFKPSDLDFQSKQPRNYFCKTLTASDTSTHGGFSVPRRAAERVFPPLDLSQQPPAQELIARDLNDNEWKFRHIFRGQPKRHLLTTGWSVFVSAKGLVAGDSVIFIWNENNRLFLGIRRANRTQTATPSSVISSDNMHLGLLAAAAHAANTNSRFTIFYSPRASPSEFVVPLAKYVKAVYHTQVSIGMRFKMLFETEESTVRRHMGTITGISDSDPARWPNSHWRSVKVGWDESGAGDKQTSVSLWEIEPLTTFSMYPNPFPSRLKRPWTHGLPSFSGMRDDDMGIGMNSYRNLQGIDISPLMQPSSIDLGIQNDLYQAMVATTDFPVSRNIGISGQALSFRQFNQMLDMANYSDSLMQPQISQKHQLQHPSEPQQRILNDFEQFSAAMPVMSRFESNSQPQSPSFQFGSHLINVPSSSTTSLSPNGLPPKRVAVDPLHRNVSSPVDQLGDLNTILYSSSTSLPRTDCRFIDQQSVDDIQTFAVNMDPNINRVHDHNDSVSVPYGADFALSSMASRMPSRTFVKVYKSRSYTRSLDISKFSSYHELRSELARMFGLEGLLENPSRSCWQLIFVDRENDVLLLGDDPWPEFVHNVWYIMILSPGEMQQYMGNQGPELSVHSVQ